MTKVLDHNVVAPGLTVLYQEGRVVSNYALTPDSENAIHLVYSVDENSTADTRIAVFMYLALSDLDSEDIKLYSEEKASSGRAQLLRYRYSDTTETYTVEIFST